MSKRLHCPARHSTPSRGIFQSFLFRAIVTLLIPQLQSPCFFAPISAKLYLSHTSVALLGPWPRFPRSAAPGPKAVYLFCMSQSLVFCISRYGEDAWDLLGLRFWRDRLYIAYSIAIIGGMATMSVRRAMTLSVLRDIVETGVCFSGLAKRASLMLMVRSCNCEALSEEAGLSSLYHKGKDRCRHCSSIKHK
jgi:hypothetical protein